VFVVAQLRILIELNGASVDMHVIRDVVCPQFERVQFVFREHSAFHVRDELGERADIDADRFPAERTRLRAGAASTMSAASQ